jgi:hypothetical protein
MWASIHRGMFQFEFAHLSNDHRPSVSIRSYATIAGTVPTITTITTIPTHGSTEKKANRTHGDTKSRFCQFGLQRATASGGVRAPTTPPSLHCCAFESLPRSMRASCALSFFEEAKVKSSPDSLNGSIANLTRSRGPWRGEESKGSTQVAERRVDAHERRALNARASNAARSDRIPRSALLGFM